MEQELLNENYTVKFSFGSTKNMLISMNILTKLKVKKMVKEK